MSRLLDDLLDIARITQGKIGFRKKVAGSERLDFRRRTSHATGNGSASAAPLGHPGARVR